MKEKTRNRPGIASLEIRNRINVIVTKNPSIVRDEAALDNLNSNVYRFKKSKVALYLRKEREKPISKKHPIFSRSQREDWRIQPKISGEIAISISWC